MENGVKNTLEKTLRVPISGCDCGARLGVADTFSLFMDMAAEHAELLGCGGAAMAARGLFWLTVRTRVRFFERPALMDEVTAATWPGKPGHVRCERFYTLSNKDMMLAQGRTEWAVLDSASGKLSVISDIYPEGLLFREDAVCEEPFVRMNEDFDGAQKLGEYTVRSTDIDLGGHMNNAAYVHALMGVFTAKQLSAMRVSELEVCFRAPCFEGETLTVFSRPCAQATEFAMLRPDAKVALVARMSFH